MPKPVCVPCERFMRPKRNGLAWIEGMPVVPQPIVGKAAPDGSWKPYKLWISDLWHCPSCDAQIIIGHAPEPVAEQHQSTFAQCVAAFGAKLLVKDC